MEKKSEIREGEAKISFYKADIVSRDLPVFYNPLMKKNRDITILILKTLGMKDMIIADPMAGSGIRSIRLFKKLEDNAIKRLLINDYSKESIALIEENLKKNNITEKAELSRHEANVFIMGTRGFHYIDIDPFGSPTPFLDSTMKKIARDGIIGVTATDTAPLAGTYPKACRRRYWANPVLDANKHETGIRILVRKVQLIGAQYDKTLTPIYCYYADHYFRIFFRCDKGKTKVDEILKKHGMKGDAGPLWLGKLWDEKLAKKIAKINTFKDIQKMLDIISEESAIDSVGFYDLHEIAKKNRLKLKKTEDVMDRIKQKGYSVSRTHFSPTGIRSDIPHELLIEIFKD